MGRLGDCTFPSRGRLNCTCHSDCLQNFAIVAVAALYKRSCRVSVHFISHLPTLKDKICDRQHQSKHRVRSTCLLTSFLPTSTLSSSDTFTPPVVSTYASGASPITARATSRTVLFFFIKTQSRKTGSLLPPAPPDVKALIFRTGKTGTRPSMFAARDRTCTTPVLPNRYRTRSLRLSSRVVSFSSSSFRPPPCGSPSEMRSSRVSKYSEPSM